MKKAGNNQDDAYQPRIFTKNLREDARGTRTEILEYQKNLYKNAATSRTIEMLKGTCGDCSYLYCPTTCPIYYGVNK